MNAGRTVRRAESSVAVPALLEAVATHKDVYVRFKALVVLSGFNDPRIGDPMVTALDDRNDRLRAAAYGWFEHHPDPKMRRAPAGGTDQRGVGVRPAGVDAALGGTDPKVREVMTGLVMRGQDLFRAVVIEALGEYAPPMRCSRSWTSRGSMALCRTTRCWRSAIGDKRGLLVLADLQRTAPRNLQPSIAAAICLEAIAVRTSVT